MVQMCMKVCLSCSWGCGLTTPVPTSHVDDKLNKKLDMNRSDLAAVLPSEWRWNGHNTKERVWLVLWNLEWKKIPADGRFAAIFRTADPTTQGWMNLLYSQMFGVWFTFTDSYRSASFPWTPKLYRHERLESYLCGQRKWEEKGNKMARVLHGVVWKSGLRGSKMASFTF